MNRKGLLVVISGFSGVGKGTMVKALLKNNPDKYALSISATTRSPREGESNGVEYFFISKEEFINKINNNELLEYANYVGNYYGTPRKYVEDNLNNGRNVILEIELQGALQVKEKFPQAMLVFIIPPHANGLKDRLTGRGTEDKETINKRIERAKEEILSIDKYDYVLVNDILDKSVKHLDELIESEKNRTERNKENIKILKQEFENLEL